MKQIRYILTCLLVLWATRAQAQFVSDNFTDTAGTAITVHSGTTGALIHGRGNQPMPKSRNKTAAETPMPHLQITPQPTDETLPTPCSTIASGGVLSPLQRLARQETHANRFPDGNKAA